MAVNSGEDKKIEGAAQGFAGLSSMLSEVDVAVGSAGQEDHPTSTAEPSRDQSNVALPAERDVPINSPQAYQAPIQSTGWSAEVKWLLGIVAGIAFIWLLSNSGEKNAAPKPSYTQSASTATPEPSLQPSPTDPVTQSRPFEEMPPVGDNNVLGSAQIRYCLAEDIRLQSAKNTVNSHNNLDVNKFNEMITDYNSRCGAFRYKQGALESARSEIEPFRSELNAEGGRRFSLHTQSPPFRAPPLNPDYSPAIPDVDPSTQEPDSPKLEKSEDEQE